ncbi:MAG: cytochrome c [Anaerolineae bacterium]|nr:cytochrome c [Anaerolineae bacterium]
MKKVIAQIGKVIGGLIVLALLIVISLSISGKSRINKTYQIQAEAVAIPTDNASIEEGKRLALFYCAGCHGEDFSGTEFFNEPALAVVDARNLTPGKGGIGSQYSDADWVLAIRHGVDTQGRPLFIMPANDFYHLGDEDLGQIIAYMKSLSPVDNDTNDFKFGFMGSVLLGLGAFGDVLTAENIDHTGPRPEAPKAGVSEPYGKYLVDTFGCATCHGSELSGGKGPEPGSPPGPNLTPNGNLEHWTESVFIESVRNRTSEWMPFESMAKMNDDELKAVWVYLQSLPAVETATK